MRRRTASALAAYVGTFHIHGVIDGVCREVMDSNRDVSEQALMIEMGLTPQNIELRKKYVGLGPDDLARIGTIKEVVRQRGEEFVTVFFKLAQLIG